MTFAQETGNREEEGSQYPTAFGITFTPTNSGIGVGVLGILGAIYVWMTFGMPSYDKYNQLKTQEADKQAQVNLQKNGDYQRKLGQVKQELIQAQKLQETAYSLFATAQAGDTLLLDIDKFVRSRKATLNEFIPENTTTVIADGSLGPLVNNKLKRQSFNVKVEGEFLKVHELMRDLERLQPLLLVKNFNAIVTVPDAQGGSVDGGNKIMFKAKYKNGKITYEQEKNSKIKAKFRLDLIFPLSPEEMATLNTPPAAASPSPSPK